MLGGADCGEGRNEGKEEEEGREWERWKEGNDRGGGGVKEKKEIWREIRQMEGKEKNKGR